MCTMNRDTLDACPSRHQAQLFRYLFFFEANLLLYVVERAERLVDAFIKNMLAASFHQKLLIYNSNGTLCAAL
jgi:hypothetical protein